MQTSLVSIIVPIYNLEKRLLDCVDSLINQTYKKIEIILVNDGSSDRSPEICDKLVFEDNRITVIHKKNQGLSSARNDGMKISTGEYIMFVDGDDWIKPNCIEECVKTIEANVGTDIVMFPYIKEYKDRSEKVYLFSNEYIHFDDKKTKEILLKRLFGPTKPIDPLKIDNLSTAWGKLYRRTIINNIEFVDTKKIGVEDSYYNIEAFYNARSCEYITTTFYHYNKTNEQSLTNNFDLQSAYLRENMYSTKKEFITKKSLGENYKVALNNRVVVNLFGSIYSIVNSNSNFSEKVSDCETILRRPIYSVAFSTFDFAHLKIEWKPFYWLCRQKKSRTIIFLLNTLLNMREGVKFARK